MSGKVTPAAAWRKVSAGKLRKADAKFKVYLGLCDDEAAPPADFSKRPPRLETLFVRQTWLMPGDKHSDYKLHEWVHNAPQPWWAGFAPRTTAAHGDGNAPRGGHISVGAGAVGNAIATGTTSRPARRGSATASLMEQMSLAFAPGTAAAQRVVAHQAYSYPIASEPVPPIRESAMLPPPNISPSAARSLSPERHGTDSSPTSSSPTASSSFAPTAPTTGAPAGWWSKITDSLDHAAPTRPPSPSTLRRTLVSGLSVTLQATSSSLAALGRTITPKASPKSMEKAVVL